MSDENEPVPVPVKLGKGGVLTIIDEGSGLELVVARYDAKTAVLEFESEESEAKHRRQCVEAVTQVKRGNQIVPSGRDIREFAIKGRPSDSANGQRIPPRPKSDPMLGDTTPAVVKWYFQYHPQKAYARYRVFLDENGEPIRRDVQRKSVETIVDRDGNRGLEMENDNRGQQVLKSPKLQSWERGFVARKGYLDQFDQQIIARRATVMTFTPNEVLGGFDVPYIDEPTKGVGVREEEEA